MLENRLDSLLVNKDLSTAVSFLNDNILQTKNSDLPCAVLSTARKLEMQYSIKLRKHNPQTRNFTLTYEQHYFH